MTDTRRPVPSQQTRPSPPPPPSPSTPDGERWIDLREAAQLTGIPASTIRNWARKQRIDSRFEMDESGDRRYVELTEVIAWADHLGRQHRQVASRESLPADLPAGSSSFGTRSRSEEEVAGREADVASEEEVTGREADVADDNAIRDSQFADVAEPTAGEPPEEPGRAEDEIANRESRIASGDTRDEELATRDVPEGTMLVPLDAWNKMLNQLGNLHEAGQQLAEARERAAKAETEVQFLRERLSELREQPRTVTPEPDAPPPPEDPVDPLWVDLYRRWKRRRH